MPFQLTTAGLSVQNQAEILDEMSQALKTATKSDGTTLAFGPNWLTTPDSVDWQQLNIFAEFLAQAQEAVAETYNSIGPGAQGKTLHNVAIIAGAPFKTATKSKVTARISAGGGGSNVPKGTVFKTSDTGAQFATAVAVVVPPNGTADVVCESLEWGPVAALAASLTVIVTPVAGMTAVTNPANAVLGQNDETDPEWRTRHLDSLALPGTRTIDAMRAGLLQLAGVTDARVFENVTGAVNGDGMPGHSIWAVVDGGDEQEIANLEFVRKADGIETYGAITKTVQDTQGGTDTVKFSRPTLVDIYAVVQMTPAASAGEQTTCKTLLVAAITALKIDADVAHFLLLCAIADTFAYKTAITLTIGKLADLSDQGVVTIAIGKSQRATTVAGKVTVS